MVLDSNHSGAPVEQDLELYSELVTPGSSIIACANPTGGYQRAAHRPASSSTVRRGLRLPANASEQVVPMILAGDFCHAPVGGIASLP